MIKMGIILLVLGALLFFVGFMVEVERKKHESDQNELKDLRKQFDEAVEDLLGGE